MDTSLILRNLGGYVRRVGRVVARPAVLMYLVLRDEATPKRDKYIVYAALAYLVLPINLISSKRIPILGWADEAGAVALAYKRIKDNITPAMEAEADKMLDKWFEGVEEVPADAQ